MPLQTYSSKSPSVASSSGPPPAVRGPVCTTQILTINVEEYFQAGVFHRFIESRNWYRFDSRLQQSVEETLKVLDQQQTTATFFVLGWIAEKHPGLIASVSQAGHEIASRGFLHQPLLKLERRERFEDLKRSRLVLEDITGKQVCGFRLSDGWLRSSDLPFLEDVCEAGYLYDSSLMPRRRDFRNDPSRRTIHTHALRGGTLLEIPPSTIRFAGSWLPIAGGNYQRQFPNALMRSAVTRWVQTETSPFVMYFQVWEMDSEQPKLSAVSRLARIRHYRNLGKYRWLLPEYLKSWRFCSVRDHARLPNSPLKSLTIPAVVAPRSNDRLNGTPAQSMQSPGIESDQPQSYREPHIQPHSKLIQHQRPSTKTGVTLVVPCFNEEGSLPYLARTLEHLKNLLSRDYRLHVLFVDDCSSDSTQEVLRELFGREIDTTIVRHERNQGVSAAILTGISAAETEIVCSIDCDCSYDPAELESMLPLMTSGVAMVTASPYHRRGKVRNVPAWRLVLSRSLSLMYRLLLGETLATWTSCFRVYRRSFILDLPLQENGFLGTAELAAQLCLHRRPIIEHPAVLEVRLFGMSKLKTLQTIGRHLMLLGRIAIQPFSKS